MWLLNYGNILLPPATTEVKFIAVLQILHVCAAYPLGCSAALLDQI